MTILYRVRKSWDDVKSQLGAFSNKQNAIDLAKKNVSYMVYDSDGNQVYPEIVPTTPVVSIPPANVHEGHHDIIGKSVVSLEQMLVFVQQNNKDFDKNIAQAYLTVGEKYGICGDITFCQSIIETGWFKFEDGTTVTPDQHNYCGMGVTQKGMKGNSFDTIEDGVTAQMQHLLAYASKNNIPNGDKLLDPRFDLVTRGVVPHWEDLNNHWAMNDHYGQDIVALHGKLLKVVPQPIEEPQKVEEPVKEAPVEVIIQPEPVMIEQPVAIIPVTPVVEEPVQEQPVEAPVEVPVEAPKQNEEPSVEVEPVKLVEEQAPTKTKEPAPIEQQKSNDLYKFFMIIINFIKGLFKK